jgi:integration host factor subunit alpha
MTGKNITRVDLYKAVYLVVSRSESVALVELVLKLSSFGSFIVRKKKQRVGRNPKTGTETTIWPRRKPSAILKQQINGKSSGTKTSSLAELGP